jgi:hypothetical protein
VSIAKTVKWWRSHAMSSDVAAVLQEGRGDDLGEGSTVLRRMLADSPDAILPLFQSNAVVWESAHIDLLVYGYVKDAPDAAIAAALAAIDDADFRQKVVEAAGAGGEQPTEFVPEVEERLRVTCLGLVENLIERAEAPDRWAPLILGHVAARRYEAGADDAWASGVTARTLAALSARGLRAPAPDTSPASRVQTLHQSRTAAREAAGRREAEEREAREQANEAYAAWLMTFGPGAKRS